MVSHPPILPERVRAIRAQTFAWLPHRFLGDGFVASLTPDERSLYLFLVLAADRAGVSFYGYDKICAVLGVPLHDYIAARNRLIDKDLLAFDGTRFQILSLPPRPVAVAVAARPLSSPADYEDRDPATIRRILEDDLGSHRR